MVNDNISSKSLSSNNNSSTRREPLISVITVNLNDAAGLRKTVLSVLNQRYQRYEHIVIDGASKDLSVDTWKNVTSGDKRFLIFSETDSGIYDAMNKGLGKASGDLIQFLNAGDTLSDDMVFSRVANSWVESPDWYWGFGGLRIISKEGNRVEEILKAVFSPKDFRWGNSYVPHPSSFVSTHLFVAHGGFDPGFGIAADQEFFFKISKRHYPMIWEDTFANFQLGGAHSTLSPWQKERIWHQMRKAHSLLAFNSNVLDAILTELMITSKIAKAVLSKIFSRDR